MLDHPSALLSAQTPRLKSVSDHGVKTPTLSSTTSQDIDALKATISNYTSFLSGSDLASVRCPSSNPQLKEQDRACAPLEITRMVMAQTRMIDDFADFDGLAPVEDTQDV